MLLLVCELYVLCIPLKVAQHQPLRVICPLCATRPVPPFSILLLVVFIRCRPAALYVGRAVLLVENDRAISHIHTCWTCLHCPHRSPSRSQSHSPSPPHLRPHHVLDSSVRSVLCCTDTSMDTQCGAPHRLAGERSVDTSTHPLPTYHVTPSLLCSSRPFHHSLLPSARLFLPLFLLLLFTSVCCAVDPLPPIQHHVYYSSSHITSIAVKTSAGDLYATDVANSRIIHYNSSGNVAAEWSVTEPHLYSPTSLVYATRQYNPSARVMYVADSTIAAVVKVNPDNGTQDGSRTLTVPSELWECGVLLTQTYGQFIFVYLLDRYRGQLAKLESDPSQPLMWQLGPPPTPPDSNSTATHLAALAVSSEFNGKVTLFVVEQAADRVVQIDARRGVYRDTLTFALPDDVSGIQAVSWTECSEVPSYGCLWVMYQPNGSSGSERSVIAVSVLDSTVLHNWTVGAATGGAERATAPALRDGDQTVCAATVEQQRAPRLACNARYWCRHGCRPVSSVYG